MDTVCTCIVYDLKKHYMKSANFMRYFMNKVNKAISSQFTLRMFMTVPSHVVNTYTDCTTVREGSPDEREIPAMYLRWRSSNFTLNNP